MPKKLIFISKKNVFKGKVGLSFFKCLSLKYMYVYKLIIQLSNIYLVKEMCFQFVNYNTFALFVAPDKKTTIDLILVQKLFFIKIKLTFFLTFVSS